jgi:hypothetical protein
VRIVERLAQDVGRSLGRGELLQQRVQRELERLALLRGPQRIVAKVDRVGLQRPDGDLATRAGGLPGGERDPRRHRDEERGRVAHLAAVGPLPADPRVLNHIIRIGLVAQHVARDAEQAWAHAREGLRIGVRHRVRALCCLYAAELAFETGRARPGEPLVWPLVTAPGVPSRWPASVDAGLDPPRAREYRRRRDEWRRTGDGAARP